jgi:hypothetical protein
MVWYGLHHSSDCGSDMLCIITSNRFSMSCGHAYQLQCLAARAGHPQSPADCISKLPSRCIGASLLLLLLLVLLLLHVHRRVQLPVWGCTLTQAASTSLSTQQVGDRTASQQAVHRFDLVACCSAATAVCTSAEFHIILPQLSASLGNASPRSSRTPGCKPHLSNTSASNSSCCCAICTGHVLQTGMLSPKSPSVECMLR